jgi:hypothetical protein
MTLCPSAYDVTSDFKELSYVKSKTLLYILIVNIYMVKGRKMENVRNENGTCGCGKSPTGDCVGWHELTPEQYEAKTDTDKEAMFGNAGSE